jgi:hypothetical protein
MAQPPVPQVQQVPLEQMNCLTLHTHLGYSARQPLAPGVHRWRGEVLHVRFVFSLLAFKNKNQVG